MKIGDIIQIDGRLGFTTNAKYEVLDMKSNLVKIGLVGRGGLLGSIEESWYSIDMLKIKKQD